MMKIIGGLGAGLFYLCAASFLAVLVMLAVIKMSWGIDRERLQNMIAVARGVDLVDVGIKVERQREKESLEQASLDNILTRLAIEDKHRRMREEALENMLEQLRFDRQQLSDAQRRFLARETQFEDKIAKLKNDAIENGMEDNREKLITIKPAMAKELLMQMLADGELDQVVLLFQGMPNTKAAKIMAEFETPMELEQLGEILKKIREGYPYSEIAQAAEQP